MGRFKDERDRLKNLAKRLADIIYENHMDKKITEMEEIRDGIKEYNNEYNTELTHRELRKYISRLSEKDKTEIVRYKAHYLTLERLLNKISLDEHRKKVEKKDS